jgi:hypothetical protein
MTTTPTTYRRCQAGGDYCDEVTARQAAAVDAIAVGCWDHADQLAAAAARIADVHRQELELQRGRR